MLLFGGRKRSLNTKRQKEGVKEERRGEERLKLKIIENRKTVIDFIYGVLTLFSHALD